MNRRIIYMAIALVGILLVIISLGLYFIPTMNLKTAKNTFEIVYPHNYIKTGLFAPKRYVEYTVIPTRMTKTDIPYLVVVNNGLVRKEGKVKWSALELGIYKPKTITHSLTSDEYTAVSVLPEYEIMVYEVRPERDANYLMIPFAYIGLLSLVILAGFGKKQPVEKQKPDIQQNVAMPSKRELTKDRIDRCMNCDSFKMTNGILQCNRKTCKYD